MNISDRHWLNADSDPTYNLSADLDPDLIKIECVLYLTLNLKYSKIKYLHYMNFYDLKYWYLLQILAF